MLSDLTPGGLNRSRCPEHCGVTCRVGIPRIPYCLLCHNWVACSRYNGLNPETIKAKIINLIQEGVCYVPLIKSDTLGPKVGDIYSPTSPYKLVSEIEDVFNPASQAEVSLKDIRNMKVWAIAGPMSPQEGQEFRRAWKSPRMKRANFRENLKITDGDRGFEHYGRELADNHATSWQEYWPFLNQFADLRSESGLEALENFFKKQSVIIAMQTFFKPPVQFVHAEPFRVNVAYILKPSLDSSISLEGEHFVSLDSTFSDTTSSSSEQNEKSEIHHPVLPVKEIVDVHNKSSPGILSSLWGGLAKIKGYLSQNTSKITSSPVIHIKPPEAETSDPAKPPEAENFDQTKPTELDPAEKTKPPESEPLDKSLTHSVDSLAACHPSPLSVSASHGDKVDVKIKDCPDPSQTLPLSVGSKESSFSSREANNSALPDPKSELVSQQSLTKDHQESFTDENESSIPEAFACRSHLDNSLTPRHWKYRTPRHSLDSPEKSGDRDSESPSRRSSGARKYHSDSEKYGESPVRRASRLTKHRSDLHNAQSRSSPSKKDSSSSFNTKMDSLCRHLDKFSIASPDKSAPSLSPSSISCDMTSSFRSVLIEPSLHIFTGKMFSKLTINLNRTRGDASGKLHLHDLPVACLRQDSDVGTVLADIFFPHAVSDSTWLSSVLDEQSHCEIMKNVWVDFLTVFPDSDNAKKVCSLPSDEVLNVVVEGLHEDDKLSCRNIKELYKESLENIEEKMSMTVEMRVIRVNTIPKKEVFVCGSVPTKVDADIFSTLNSQSYQLIRGQSQRFTFCKQWLGSMDRPGKDFISSLPSPSRVIRLERRELFPVSPLVLNDTKFPPQLTSTPKSSRVTHVL
ncbi:hypothetical protein Btru_053029 [Bulinus truncatus]|nr:hypothetical protein Btru_053029 [Bulinus truncatus]